MLWGQRRRGRHHRRYLCTANPIKLLMWLNTNCRVPCSADIISTVEFDHTGNYLATGDKGGRVVLFERNEGVSFSDLSRCRVTLTRPEKNMRIQVPHRVSIARARIRLPQIIGD